MYIISSSPVIHLCIHPFSCPFEETSTVLQLFIPYILTFQDSTSFSLSVSRALSIAAFIPREEKARKLRRERRKVLPLQYKSFMCDEETKQRSRPRQMERSQRDASGCNCTACENLKYTRLHFFLSISLSFSPSLSLSLSYSLSRVHLVVFHKCVRVAVVIEFHGFAIISKVHDRQ